MRAPSARLPKQEEGIAEFYFKEQILDQLEVYMRGLRRMKRTHPEHYAICSKLGAHILPQKVGIFSAAYIDGKTDVSPWWRSNRPSTGAVALGVGDKAEEIKATREDAPIHPKFLVFQRYDRHKAPPELQRVADGDVYLVTAHFDAPFDPRMKNSFAADFAAVIRPDGHVEALRVAKPAPQVIHHRRRRRDGSVTTLYRRKWDIPCEWWRPERAERQKFLVLVFLWALESYEAANASMIRVAASKDKLTATFGVNILRTPYFFKDREVTVGESGARRRIFHIVRAHDRVGSKGVCTHFRGEREFEWNGYAIKITVPGWHHADLASWQAAGKDFGEDEPMPAGYLDGVQVAALLKQHVEAAPYKRGSAAE